MSLANLSCINKACAFSFNPAQLQARPAAVARPTRIEEKGEIVDVSIYEREEEEIKEWQESINRIYTVARVCLWAQWVCVCVCVLQFVAASFSHMQMKASVQR